MSIAAVGHLDSDGDFICNNCSFVFEHNHIWNNGAITTPATCTEAGVKTYTCPCGETKTETITAPGHIDENGDLSCDRCEIALTAKNGLVFDSDGNIRYYVNGVATRARLVQDSEGNYYYINSSLKAVKNCTYSFSDEAGNGLLPGGTYKFDASGKMIDPPVDEDTHNHTWGDGIVSVPATCTESGIMTYVCECGISKTEAIIALDHVDENTDYVCDRCGLAIDHTHAWDDGVVTKPATCTEAGVKTYTCSCGETKTEVIIALDHIDENIDYDCDRCGVTIDHSHIDENGDLSCDRCGTALAAKNGLVFDSDGNIRYYVNGVATRARLVQDSEGNYYYINSTLKAVKNCTYSFSDEAGNGLLPGGTYQFDADGKLILSV